MEKLVKCFKNKLLIPKSLTLFFVFIMQTAFLTSGPHIHAKNTPAASPLYKMVLFGDESSGYYLINQEYYFFQGILKVIPSKKLAHVLEKQTTVKKQHLKKLDTLIKESDVTRLSSKSENVNISIYVDYIDSNDRSKMKRKTYPMTIEKISFLKNQLQPSANSYEIASRNDDDESNNNDKPEYLVFGTQEQLWVAHLKQYQNDFLHIMKIKTDATTIYPYIKNSNEPPVIENSDPKNSVYPFDIAESSFSRFKNMSNFNLNFDGKLEYLVEVK